MPSRSLKFAAGLALVIGGVPTESHASGYAIQEHGVSGLGNAYAGGAAAAEDASTVFFNPAGMALVEKPQLALGAHFIAPKARYRDEGSRTLGRPTQGPDATSREEAILPNAFFVAPFSDELVWGVGLSVPFGLTTDFDADWVGRYVARRTELKTLMLNPSLAYRVTDKLSIGGGISYVKADAVLSNAIDMGLVFLNQFQAGGIPVNPQSQALAADIQANLGGTKYDGGLRLEGDGDGWGYNFGALFEATESTRFGIHYRSKVALNLRGTADFEVGALDSVLGPSFQDQGGRVDIDLPDTLSVSVFTQFNDRLAVMADVTRTWWSKFEDLIIQFENPSPPDSVIPENWRDVQKYSVGASYRFGDRFTGRIGLAYDESPVPSDAFRSPRIPDEDRRWLSLGLSYAATESIDLHLAYLRIFVDDPRIDNDTHTAEQRLVGRIDASVDLVSFGLNKRF